MAEKTIRIKTKTNAMPETHGNWTDLALSEEVTLHAGEITILPLGVAMQLPEGYYALVAPRSSTAIKWGVLQANSIGVIDHDYCGDNDYWGFPVYATRDITIPKGTRVCQFALFEENATPKFVKVKTLDNSDRGGFGSTGA